MSELIGVKYVFQDMYFSNSTTTQYAVTREAQLKRQVLLFDKIGLLDLDRLFKGNDQATRKMRDEESEWVNNLAWLTDQQILFPIKDVTNTELFSNFQPEILPYATKLRERAESLLAPDKLNAVEQKLKKMRRINKALIRVDDALNEFVNGLKDKVYSSNNMLQLKKRIAWLNKLRANEGLDYTNEINESEEIFSILIRLSALKMESENKKASFIPLLSLPDYYSEIPASRKNDVVEIVINKLPLPSATTPWEAILDYRNDNETRKSLRALRNWMRNIASKDLPAREIEDELESLMDEFDNHMKLHKLKADTEVLQTLVKAPLGLIENLLRVKPTQIIEPLFAFRKRRISLMEAEINAPGKEIAYIVKANETFYDEN